WDCRSSRRTNRPTTAGPRRENSSECYRRGDPLMTQKKTRPKGPCYLCGIAAATEWDHVPAQNLFPKGARKGYVLGACAPCHSLNRKLSGDEELLRDFLVISAAPYKVTAGAVLDALLRDYSRLYNRLQAR